MVHVVDRSQQPVQEQVAWRRMVSAALTVSSAMGLVKALGGLKVILIARAYGTTNDLDAYLLAFLIPSFAGDVVASTSSPALVPLYIEAGREGEQARAKLLAGFLSATTAGCLVLMALIVAFAGPIVGTVGVALSPAKLEMTRQMLLIMSPVVLFGGIASVWRSALNAIGEYAIPALTFAFTPVTLAILVLLPQLAKDGWLLAFGTTCGAGLECIATGFCLWRKDVSPRPAWHGIDPRLRQAASQYWPVFLSSIVFGASAYVHQAIAGGMGAGSVSALNYGGRVPVLLLALGPAALGTAVLPQFAVLAARGEWHALRGTLMRALRLIVLVAVPLTAVAISFSEPVVRLAFERGQFTASDTDLVARVQQFYLLQVPLALPAALLARLLSTIQANGVLLAGAVVSLAANTAFGLTFTASMGVAGLAAGASLAALCHLGCLWWMLARSAPWGK